jgi:tartrate dehydrogenase/decarboxylase/D-malate dehydrogenase
MLIVRENTEGEYSSVGGRMYKNSDQRNCNSRNNNV